MPVQNSRQLLSEQAWRLVICCVSINVLYLISNGISEIPRLRLLESIVCDTYYKNAELSEGTIPEERCKVDDVQSQLSYLRGWSFFIDNIVQLFLAMPYSMLAQTQSRRLLIAVGAGSRLAQLMYIYFICYFSGIFNVHLIWFSSFFDLFGGGKLMFFNLIRILIAESVPSSSLSIFLYYIGAVLTLCRMAGVMLGSALEEDYLWPAILLSCVVQALTVPVALLLREPENFPQSAVDLDSPLIDDQSELFSPLSFPESPKSPWRTRTSEDRWQRLVEPKPTLLRRLLDQTAALRAYPLVSAAFFSYKFGLGFRSIIEQWASTSFHWPLATVGYVMSSEALTSAAVLLVLPSISRYVNEYRSMPIEAINLYVVQISLVFAFAGALCMGLAPTGALFVLSLVVYTLASGFREALRAYLTGQTKRPQITTLYTCIAVSEKIATMVNGPIWASVFSFGLKLGGLANGLPLFVSAACCVCTGVALYGTLR